MTRRWIWGACLVVMGCSDCEKKPAPAPAASAGPAASAAPSGPVVFGAPRWQAGDRFEEEWVSRLELPGLREVPGGKPEPAEMLTIDRGILWLDVVEVGTDGAPTKVGVQTKLWEQASGPQDRLNTTAKPGSGGRFNVVRDTDGGWQVSGEGDETPPEEVVGLLRQRVANFVDEPLISQALRRAPVPPRVELPELAKAFAQSQAAAETAKGGPVGVVDTATAMLESVEGGLAVFRVDVSFGMGDSKMQMHLALKGQVKVDVASARVVRVLVDGPVVLAVEGRGAINGTSREQLTRKVRSAAPAGNLVEKPKP